MAVISDGTHKTPNYTSSGVPFLSVQNISSGRLDMGKSKYIAKEEHKKLCERIAPQKGDILLCRIGTLGKAIKVYWDFEFSIFVSLGVLRPILSEIADYIVSYINSPIGFRWIQSVKVGGGTHTYKINLNDIPQILICIPPLEEQYRISNELNLLNDKVIHYGRLQERLDELSGSLNAALKKSILQEAIQGKLTSQDPADEPASVLLDRIRVEKEKLQKVGKIKKKDIVDSVIYKGEDNKYYETIAGNNVEIELPYSFPASWAIVRLQSICALLDGEKKTGDGICLDAKYLRRKSIGEHLQSGKFVHKGDNIILVDGENSGEVFSVPVNGYMGSTFKQLWISNSLHIPYVLAFIRFYKDELRNSKKGAAIPHLNKDVFNNLIIGIPPIYEQIRIIEKLNSINEKL